MNTSSSPKIRNMNEKAEINAAPRAMNTARMTSATQDPERQDPLLVLGGHRERRHDHDEDEQVVDRQALLDDVAGEVLGAEVPARDQPEDDAEGDRDADVEDRREDRLAEADGVRVARPRHEQVEHEQAGDQSDRGRPPGERDVQHGAHRTAGADVPRRRDSAARGDAAGTGVAG